VRTRANGPRSPEDPWATSLWSAGRPGDPKLPGCQACRHVFDNFPQLSRPRLRREGARHNWYRRTRGITEPRMVRMVTLSVKR
jgi:hypothetical protein